MKNNQGFLLSESLVVATILLTALVIIYAQYAKTYLKIRQTRNYNTKEAMYLSEQITSYLRDSEYADSLMTCLGDDNIKNVSACTTIPGLTELITNLDVEAYVGQGNSFKSNLIANIPWNNYMNYLDLKLPDADSCVNNQLFIFAKSNDNQYGYSVIKFNNYNDPILQNNDPVIDDTDMLPVFYDETNHQWEVANRADKWYDYANKKWANAVLLKDNPGKSRQEYMCNPGMEVNESDIKAYMVWIPRYKYKISSNCGTPSVTGGTIDVTFEKDLQTTGTDSVMCGSGYYTHPAFTWNGTALPGFWVGKFETTGTAANPTVLPNLTSISGINNIKGQYDSSKNLYSGKSHMMKNTEWGAVAYLTQSQYGKTAQIYNNNVSTNGGYTGRSGGAVNAGNSFYGSYSYDGITCVDATCSSGTHNKMLEATGASTTGNITGIYDMAGGLNELVMANFGGKREPIGFPTGLDGYATDFDLPPLYEYNKYLTTNVFGTNSIKGDATYETQSWYDEWYGSPIAASPWIQRGISPNFGVYAVAGHMGVTDATGPTFRIVALP